MDNSTVFVIVNAPNDKEYLEGFIEATLQADVTYLEYSSAFEGTVLVSVDCDAGLEEISKRIQEEEEDLEGRLGPIKILDPGVCDDSVTVTNLDKTFLCPLFLRLYIESTFADGHNVVCGCQWIPQYDKTVVVTFKDPNVIARVLKEYDHIPMASIQDYRIQFRPYYSTFYSATKIDRVEKHKTCNLVVEDDDSFEDAVEEMNMVEEEEEEMINIEKLKWQLLENKLCEKEEMDLLIEDCRMDYDKSVEVLYIRGKDVATIKLKVLQLLRNTTKITIELTEDMSIFIFRDDVNKKLTDELKGINRITFALSTNSIIVHCFLDEGIEEIIEDIEKRYLVVCYLEISEDMPTSLITDLLRDIQEKYLVIGSCDGACSKITITGVVEDVTLALKEMEDYLKNYTWINREFSLQDKAAIYVKRFALPRLEKLFGKASITNKVLDGDVISFEYKIRKMDRWDLEVALDGFTANISQTTIDHSLFQKEDLALMIGYLSTDTDLIRNFEVTNSCCIFVKDKNSNELFSTVPKVRTAKQDSDDTQHQRVQSGSSNQNSYTFDNSCQLKISRSGNVIQEPSELLVCGVHKSLRLEKTSVSKDFLKADNSLKKDIKTFAFSPAGVWVAQRPLPNTSACKAIAFITLDDWQAGQSDQQLGAAVMEVLQQADQLNIRTISFPPLGVGRFFKFPADKTAQAIVKAIDDYQTANAGAIRIKSINLIAQDLQLFSGLCKAAGSISTFVPSARSGSDTSEDDDDNGNGHDGDDSNVQGASPATDDTAVEYEIETLLPEQLPTVTIVSNEKDDVISKIFIEEIRKEWLFEELFQPHGPFCWPPEFMKEVFEIAKVLQVWVCKLNDPSTKQPFAKIKGKIYNVYRMKNEMLSLVLKINSESPRKILFSPTTPQRGTMEFMKHAATCDEQFPTYWKLKWKDFQNNSKQQHQTALVDVDKYTEKAIIKLVVDTWESSMTGLGNDAVNIPSNCQVKVVKVQRLENPTLFLKYCIKRKFILQDMVKRGHVCHPLDTLKNSKGPANTMLCLSDGMRKELVEEINECYLFHATKEVIVKSISYQGMDNRLSSAGAMFGQGVYTAEKSVKADQYADDRDLRLPTGSNLYMFLTRVALGDVFLCDDKHKSVLRRDSPKLKRPPCLSCGEDSCHCEGSVHYHSVMGDGKWIFREFVVYERDQSYPEYLITYQRV